jgi:hypothetical protein
MFVGHYGVSFAIKRASPAIPLWVLFLAVQLLDVLWAPLVLLGVEKVRIVPGITRTNPLDLYYMPYTHSLIGAAAWSLAAYVVYRLWRRANGRAAVLVGLAVFSHWVLDFVAHRPDLPLYDDTAKVGLGLWNLPALAFLIELLLLFGFLWAFLRTQAARKTSMLIFGGVMAAVQAVVFFGPPPDSDTSIAITAIVAYVLFTGLVAWWERRRPLLAT